MAALVTARLEVDRCVRIITHINVQKFHAFIHQNEGGRGRKERGKGGREREEMI